MAASRRSTKRSNVSRVTGPTLFDSSVGVDAASISKYTSFVIMPTRSDYSAVDPKHLKAEMEEVTILAQHDIIRLGVKAKPPKAIYPNVICTGYTGGIHVEFSKLTEALSTLENLDDAAFVFYLVAHGSPGVDGEIGIGWGSQETKEQSFHDYMRLSIDELVALMFNNGLKQLSKCKLHFVFNSCNSAYVPLEPSDKSKPEFDAKLLKQSFIGSFFHKMKEAGFENIEVTGVRGFYCGGEKVSLSDGARSYEYEVGEASILNDGSVRAHRGHQRIANIPKLASQFVISPSAVTKNVRKKH